MVGTAGHIDHGKTSLIHALTGIDTDRLAEEKRRGISIDLGFAYLSLPNGGRVSFIDVPGHERFIRNMLAGVGGIQAVLLIVAADQSVKPQTREHFHICRLLGIEHGIIVLTKADIAAPEQIKAASEAVRLLSAGSFLGDAPLVSVSAKTGDGIAELKEELSSLMDRITPRNDGGLARLPIDRSFALKGFGTVVTGTLCSGKLRAGDKVQIHPSEKQARIRGLQVHGKAVEFAVAGQRTAVNLTAIDASEIARGFVLTHGEELEPTKIVDGSLDWLDPSEIPTHREQFTLHIGTAEVCATLKVLKKTNSQTLTRMWLSEPLLALPRDRFVIRSLSPPQTVAGGFIIDAFPPIRFSRGKTTARLEALADADPAKRLQMLIEESANGSHVSDLIKRTGMRFDELKSLIVSNPQIVFCEAAQRAVSNHWIQERARNFIDWLTAFHQKNPSAAGAPASLARLGLEPNLANLVFNHLPDVRVHGDLVSLASHKAQFSDDETQALRKIERAFREAGLQPPLMSEVLKSAASDIKKARGLLESLIKNQKLVRVTEDLVFHAEVVSHVRKSLSAHKGRKFSVPEFKEWTHVSRKYAIPLLEYLDRQRVTLRQGDLRIVL